MVSKTLWLAFIEHIVHKIRYLCQSTHFFAVFDAGEISSPLHYLVNRRWLYICPAQQQRSPLPHAHPLNRNSPFFPCHDQNEGPEMMDENCEM